MGAAKVTPLNHQSGLRESASGIKFVVAKWQAFSLELVRTSAFYSVSDIHIMQLCD